MKKILIQFDGSNFYKKVKKIAPEIHLTNFNYAEFSKNISKSKKIKLIYYVGEVKKFNNNKKSQSLYSGQQSLFSNLRNQGFDIKLGYILFSNREYHEKGVDVQIAVDLVRGAIKNEYDICYLISSDTDLLPAVKDAQAEGKKIVYVAFEKYISHALLNNCSATIVIKKNDFIKFRKKFKK